MEITLRQDKGPAAASVATRGDKGKRTRSARAMKYRKRMQNPFALVGQGFVLGGLLFFATHPESLFAAPSPAAAESAVFAAR